jgi:hypothetical protein
VSCVCSCHAFGCSVHNKECCHVCTHLLQLLCFLSSQNRCSYICTKNEQDILKIMTKRGWLSGSGAEVFDPNVTRCMSL